MCQRELFGCLKEAMEPYPTSCVCKTMKIHFFISLSFQTLIVAIDQIYAGCLSVSIIPPRIELVEDCVEEFRSAFLIPF